MGKNKTNVEQFQLRMPPGMRDRIKVYAERHGTSINSEIVRALEHHFPEQWSIEDRLADMLAKAEALASGQSDSNILKFIEEFQDTLDGIVSGRALEVDPMARQRVRAAVYQYNLEKTEDQVDQTSLSFDEEELLALDLVGRPEKYPVPPPPASYLKSGLSDRERAIYSEGYQDGRSFGRYDNKIEDDPIEDDK